MLLAYRTFSFLAFVAAAAWVIAAPTSFERWVVVTGTLAAFASAFTSPVVRRLKGGLEQHVSSHSAASQAAKGGQSQSAGSNALALQAAGDIYLVQGAPQESMTEIAIAVFKANSPILAEEAGRLALTRAEELTDKFFRQLHIENPAGLLQASQPDFQNSLLNAQREHACAGDEKLADLLVNLLVDRTKQKSRTLQQLVIDEALKTAPKLTDEQIAVLATIFLLRNVRHPARQFSELITQLRLRIVPVLKDAKLTDSTLDHLRFCGCGADAGFAQFFAKDLIGLISEDYGALFQTGFTKEDLNQKKLPRAAMGCIEPLPGSDGLFHVPVSSVKILRKAAQKIGLDDESLKALEELIKSNLTPEAKRERLVAALPEIEDAFNLWKKVGTFKLTTVGQALAHAHVKMRLGGEFYPLGIWIN